MISETIIFETYQKIMANMKNGNCKVDWGNIVHNVSNNIAASFGDSHNPLP